MDIPSPTASSTLAPNITTHALIQDKRKRNIVIGSVIGGLVLICVIVVLVYMFVFRPRIYYGNHVMITTIQQPMSQNPTYSPDATKPPKNQQIIPSGPSSRYTLTPQTGQSNSTAIIVMNSQKSCMLVSPKLERKGLVHEGDICLIWEPLSNTYLFANNCGEYLNPSSCSAAGMGNTGNQCVWNSNLTSPKCTKTPSMSSVVFRTLPKNFLDLMKNPKDDNAFVNGFLFYFSGVTKANKCDTTKGTTNACTPIKTNMLKTHTNYVLRSSQSGSSQSGSYIDPSLSSGVHNQGGAYDPTFNWQFMK